MNVIEPLAITDARLTSSTVVETAPTAWNSGTTYALNDTASTAGAAGLITVYKSIQAANLNHATSDAAWWVSIGTTYQVWSGAVTYALADKAISTTTHKVYESLQAGNLNHAFTEAAWWLELYPTNKWAMFDALRDTKTVVPSTLTFVLTPGVRCNSIALLHVLANSATITVTSSAVEVYTTTLDLNIRRTFGWYDYFFGQFATRESVVRFDLPPYTNAVVTVTLTATSGNVELGFCGIGTFLYLGTTVQGAESDVLNFSSVTRDFAGGISNIVQRRNVLKGGYSLVTEKYRVDAIAEFREHTGATPMVWCPLTDDTDGWFYALLILGFYKRFAINAQHPEHAIISLDLEEI